MTQSLNALSLAPDVNDWLANTRRPRVLHVFDRACNLINERREVLSVVTPQIGNGPFNLVVEGDILFSEHLNIESPVAVNNNPLILGDLTISTSSAKLWNPSPDWEELHANREGILNQLTQLRITGYKRSGLDTGFATSAQPYSTTVFNRESPIANYQFSSSLVTAFVNADLSATRSAAQKLAGLGQGLTPAGDDFMLGAIYAAWIIHPPEVAGVFAKVIASTAAPLTTSLSAAWLRSAGRGEAGGLWHDFFDALVSVDRIANLTYETAIQESIVKILAVGETSGADALAGFVGLFAAWMEKAGISHG